MKYRDKNWLEKFNEVIFVDWYWFSKKNRYYDWVYTKVMNIYWVGLECKNELMMDVILKKYFLVPINQAILVANILTKLTAKFYYWYIEKYR